MMEEKDIALIIQCGKAQIIRLRNVL